MNSMGFLQPVQANTDETLQADHKPLTLGEFRTLLHQFEVRLKTHLTAEISEETARSKTPLVREIVAELFGALDARENFKEYEKRRLNPEHKEDFFTEMRRLYGRSN